MTSLKGRAIVITGAASGIGRHLAFECARRGAHLLLADIDPTGLDETCAAARALGAEVSSRQVDTGSEASIAALAAAAHDIFGAIDVLINNAGVGLVAPVAALDSDDAHWLMNINFWGVVHGCRAFLPQLKSRPEAVIVNISSIFAMISVPTQSIYNASKAAVRAFSDALREELRDTPVRVLCVHPGGIRTNIVNNARVTDTAMLGMSVEKMRANFLEKMAPTSAEDAALAIVGAIERGRTRLLIGNDARVADLLFRLAPDRAAKWINQHLRRMRGRNRALEEMP